MSELFGLFTGTVLGLCIAFNVIIICLNLRQNPWMAIPALVFPLVFIGAVLWMLATGEPL